MPAEVESLLTVRQIAERFDVGTNSVLRMIREKRLEAKKVGWQWVVDESDLPESWPPPTSQT